MSDLIFSEGYNREALNHLVAVVRACRPVAFVGAGIAQRMGYPSWGGLLDEMLTLVRRTSRMAEAPLARLAREPDLLWRAQEYRELMGEDRYAAFIAERFRPQSAPVDRAVRQLVSLPFSHFVTTNYDDSLDRAHRAEQPVTPIVLRWAEAAHRAEFVRRAGDQTYERRYLHLHGRYDHPNQIVLTEEDYERTYVAAGETARMLFALFLTRPVIFFGFSLTDPDLMAVLRSIKSELGVGGPSHYAVLDLDDWDEESIVRRRLSAKFGVEPVFYRRTPDHAGLAQVIEVVREQVASAYESQHGRWGGKSEANGRRITATAKAKIGMITHGLFTVDVVVESTEPEARPLVGAVTFHLPDPYMPNLIQVPASNGRAILHRENVYAPFVVGAEADDGDTRLELDLATAPEMPQRFLWNGRHR